MYHFYKIGTRIQITDVDVIQLAIVDILWKTIFPDTFTISIVLASWISDEFRYNILEAGLGESHHFSEMPNGENIPDVYVWYKASISSGLRGDYISSLHQ